MSIILFTDPKDVMSFSEPVDITGAPTKMFVIQQGDKLYGLAAVELGAAGIPDAPNTLAPSNITTNSFSANWQAVPGAVSYRLDVSTQPDFSSFVPGYVNKEVATNTGEVTGLNNQVTYYYRVRSVTYGGTSASSNTVQVMLLVASEIGNLYDADYLTSGSAVMADYTITGAASFAYVDNRLRLSGGTGNIENYARITRYGATGLENWRYTTRFRAKSKTGTDYGLGLGVKSLAALGTKRSTWVHLRMHTATTSFGLYNNTDLLSDHGTGIGWAVDDLMRFTVERSFLTLTATIENLTQGTSYSHTFEFNLNYPSNNWFMHHTGFFSLWNLGGTFDLEELEVSSTSKANVDYLYIGDSITHGLFAGSLSDRFPTKSIEGSTKIVESNSGSDDYTQSVLDRMPEVTTVVKPKAVMLVIGGNDVFFAVPAATWQANYSSIVQQLKAAGIGVYHCLNTPRDTNITDVRPLNNWITATFGGIDKVIDTFSALADANGNLTAPYDSGDGVHPSMSGHHKVAEQIRAQAPEIL